MKLRFFLHVIVAALLPLAVVAATTLVVRTTASESLAERVAASSSALESRLAADAAARRQLLLRLSVLPGLTQPVRDAAAQRTAPSGASVATLRQAVGELFPEARPELLALATASGAQVVVNAAEPAQVAAEDLPLAAVALSGQFGETFATYDGNLYRFLAMPVGVADGAIVIGDRIGEATALRLRDQVRAGVTFISGGKVVASSEAGARHTELNAAAARPGTALPSGELQITISGLQFLSGLLPVGAPSGARWSVARDAGGGVTVVATVDSGLEWLALMQALGVGATLLALLLGVLFAPLVIGPVTRQARSLEAHLARLLAEPAARLGSRGFTGPFVPVARGIDHLATEWLRHAPTVLQREPAQSRVDTTSRVQVSPASEAVPPRPLSRPPLDLPLASEPSPDSESLEGSAAAFPFADDPHVTGRNAVGAPVAEPRAPTPAPFDLPPAPRQPTPPPQPAPVAKERTGPVPLPAPHTASPSTPPPVRAAALPPDLLERSRELEDELLGAPPADPDADHFKSVFEDYVATRQRCGESSEGLTLERFTAQLKKNREQLVQKYNCRSVRFQVYVKEGKAAVKAAPIR